MTDIYLQLYNFVAHMADYIRFFSPSPPPLPVFHARSFNTCLLARGRGGRRRHRRGYDDAEAYLRQAHFGARVGAVTLTGARDRFYDDSEFRIFA